MPDLRINGRSVTVDDEGFLVSAGDWDREVAAEIARGAGITLDEGHWKVIEFCRKDFESTGTAPGLRRITKRAGIPTKEIYKLFPGGPGKLAARIAGLHKPTSCV